MKTTTIKATWKNQWQNFYDGTFAKLWDNEYISQDEILTTLEILKDADQNIDEILEKFVEMRKIFPDLTQVAHGIHQLLSYNDEFHPLQFSIEIAENIQFCLEPMADTSDELLVRCKVEAEDDFLLFEMDEHDTDELRIII